MAVWLVAVNGDRDEAFLVEADTAAAEQLAASLMARYGDESIAGFVVARGTPDPRPLPAEVVARVGRPGGRERAFLAVDLPITGKGLWGQFTADPAQAAGIARWAAEHAAAPHGRAASAAAYACPLTLGVPVERLLSRLHHPGVTPRDRSWARTAVATGWAQAGWQG